MIPLGEEIGALHCSGGVARKSESKGPNEQDLGPAQSACSDRQDEGPESMEFSNMGTTSLLPDTLRAPTMARMSMYLDILSSALDGWVDELTGSALIDESLALRVEMLGNRNHRSASANEALAAEVAYDRALISLCAEHDIEVVLSDFADPQAERARLERKLARSGVDLFALARRGRGSQA